MLALCALHSIVSAANLTWTGAAGDNNIANRLNWSPSQAPVAGDTLNFAGAAGLLPQLAANLTVNSITFGRTAQAFILGGTGVYTINGGITNSSTATETINTAIKLGGNQTWNAATGALVVGGALDLQGFTLTNSGRSAATISGAISGTGSILQNRGSLTLSGNNTYSGTTTLRRGTLNVGSNTALGTGTFIIGGGALDATGGSRTLANAVQADANFSFTGTNALTLNGAVSLGANITATVGGSGALTLGGVVSGARTFTKAGTGTLVLNGANTFSGGLTLNSGKVVVGSNTAAGTGRLTLGAGTVEAGGAARTLANPLTLTTTAANVGPTFAGAYDLTFGGAVTMTSGGLFNVVNVNNPNTTFAGAITASGVVAKTGTGTLTLSGTSAYANGTGIGNGTLVVNAAAGAGTGTITVGDSVTVGATTPATLLLSATAGLTAANAIDVPVGSTGLRTIGTLVTTGTNTFSGAVTLGTAATLTAPAGGTLNFTNTISGAGGITKVGAGTVLLSKAATFTGPTVINDGTLMYGVADALYPTASTSTTITINGGTLDLNGFSDTVGPVTLVNGTIDGKNAALTATGTLTSNNGFTFRNGTVSANLAGTGGLTKDTAGTVTLSGTGTYSGATNVNAGVLAYGTSNVLGGGALTVSGSTLQMNGFTDTVGAVTLVSGSILGTSGATLTGTGYTLQSGIVTAALGANGSAGLVKETAGTVVISGANTYGGSTAVNAGTLRLGAAETLPNSSALTIASGATLDMNNLNDTVGSLAGAGNLLLGSGRLTSGSLASGTFSGSIGGTGGLTKVSTTNTTLTLSGVNAYTGETQVNGGTLALGNAGAGPSASRVTVASGATFNVAGFNASIGSLAGAGNVTLGAGTLTAGGDGTSSTFSGIVSGTGGGLTKAGTGTMTMTSANIFTGGFTATGGSVVLSGAAGALGSASSISLRTGTTLTLDNSTTENANRIKDTADINIQGGDLRLISDNNGTNENVGKLNFLLGPANVTVVHNGTALQGSALTFSSLGTSVLGNTLNFTGSGLGGALGTGATGPHVYITGQAAGLMGGWARVGTDFANYSTFGVTAYTSYYTGALGINVNNPSQIVLLDSTSLPTAYSLLLPGTTTDGGLVIADLPLVDLGTDATRTLNLLTGGLIKKSAPDSVISGAGRLTAGGTASVALYASVETGRKLTIASSIINNAGADGIYGNAGDGAVSIVKSDLGTLVLSGANTFTGGVYINEGVLSVSADSNLGVPTGDVFLSGGTFAVTSGFTANVGRRFEITSGLTNSFDIATGQSLTLTGASDLFATGSNASRLIKTGAGSLVLGGANPNFTGSLWINSGTVELQNAGSLGTGAVTLNGGALVLRNDANTSFTTPFTLLTDSTIGAAPLTTGTPVLSLGAVAIGEKTLTLTASGGATLSLAGATLGGNATLNATTGTTTIGAISGAFGFTKTGAGILQLNAPGTYSGTTDIQGGTLRLGTAAGIPLASHVNIGTAGTLSVNNLSATLGSIGGNGAITLGSGTLTIGGNGLPSTYGGNISGTGGITKTAGETLTLTGASTYTGATNLQAGTILLGASEVLPAATALNISSGAFLDLAGYTQTVGSLAGAGTVALGSGTLQVGDATSTTFSGDFTGTGAVTKIGTGTLSLSGNSAFTGPLTVSGGTLAILAESALGSASGATTVRAGAQLVLAGGVTVSAEPLTIAGTGSAGAGALRVDSGTAAWTGPISLSADASTGVATGATLALGDVALSGNTLTIGGAGTTNERGILSGAGALMKTGAGTLTLSGANTFTGTTTVSAGTLNIAHEAALGAAGPGNETKILSGATLSFSDYAGINIHSEALSIAGNGVSGTGAIQSLSGANISEGPVTLSADASVNTASGSSLAFLGGIGESTAARSLAKNGTGTLILGGTSTFTGTLTVNAGTLQIAADNTINGSPGVSIASGATLDLNDFSDTLGSLAGAGTVTFGPLNTGGGTLSVGANGASTTFTGNITGTGDFEKIGTGSLTLTSANSYIGNTTVSGGTLVAGNNTAFGATTQTVTLDGGALASNNDTRSLAYGINVTTAAGNQITGANSLTLTGPVTNGGAGSALEVALTDSSKSVTINPAANNSFAPGAVSLTSGTLILGGANKIADTTDLTMNGGTLRTGGFSDTVGALTLTANSVIDFGTTNNVSLQFSTATWTGGTLTINNWTGTILTSNNPDKFLVGSLPGADFLSRVSFTGYPYAGAVAFSVGGGLYEIVPVPEPATILGALALVGAVGFRERRRLRGMLAVLRR